MLEVLMYPENWEIGIYMKKKLRSFFPYKSPMAFKLIL